jgi:hypothetical protein
MKKLFTLVLLFSSLHSFSQLTPLKEINSNLKAFQLSNGEWILYSTIEENYQLKTITLYKNDFSVYKTIDISQNFPFVSTDPYKSISINEVYTLNGIDGEYLFTDKFFNSDDKIEFIIKYNSETDKKCVSIVMNEDGQEIQSFTNLNGRSIEFSFWKYLNVEFENEKTNEIITKIYSVPGNLPCPFTCGQKAAGIAPISQPNEFKKIQVTDFPNPSSEKVTLAYTLPEGVSFGTLRLYTQTGELVKEFKVSSQVDHLELPVSEYNSGTYFYELQAGGSSSGGKKMVVIH